MCARSFGPCTSTHKRHRRADRSHSPRDRPTQRVDLRGDCCVLAHAGRRRKQSRHEPPRRRRVVPPRAAGDRDRQSRRCDRFPSPRHRQRPPRQTLCARLGSGPGTQARRRGSAQCAADIAGIEPGRPRHQPPTRSACGRTTGCHRGAPVLSQRALRAVAQRAGRRETPSSLRADPVSTHARPSQSCALGTTRAEHGPPGRRPASSRSGAAVRQRWRQRSRIGAVSAGPPSGS